VTRRPHVGLHWFLPTTGDGRTLVQSGAAARAANSTRPMAEPAGARKATLEYLVEVARAAEEAGFDAALTPTGAHCPDAWITTAAVSQHVERLRFLVAFRPGTISPMLAAQQAATYQRYTGGRLALNIVTGGQDSEQRRFGDGLGKDDRYARTAEFLTILRGAWSGTPFDFHGEHLWAEGAQVGGRYEPPEIWFGGSSDAALQVAGAHADVALTWGVPPPDAAEHAARVREVAAGHGRTLRLGIRLHVVTRDTAAEAWAAADALLADADDAILAAAQRSLTAEQSVGQQKMVALHGGSRDGLEVYPNLWAGVGLLRDGAGTALVGSHAEVAERIAEYREVGYDEFILSGWPHDEEARHFGAGVVPQLRRLGLAPERSALDRS
jgi:alkanesulfonate monooxygenase